MICNRNCKQTSYNLRDIEREVIYFVCSNFKERGDATLQQDISKKFNLSYRQTNYLINKLIKNGFFRNIEKAVILIEPTKKAQDYIKAFLDDLQFDGQYVNTFFDRAHAITIIVPIKYRPKGVVPEGFSASDKSDKLNWNMPQLMYKSRYFNLMITQNTGIYYFKECYAPDPHYAVMVCLNHVFPFCQSLRKDGFVFDLPKTAIIGQEHAIFNKELAKFTSKFEIRYRSNRITFDSSISVNEFELIEPRYSSEDFLRLTDFFEAIIAGKFDIDKLIRLCGKGDFIYDNVNVDNEINKRR